LVAVADPVEKAMRLSILAASLSLSLSACAAHSQQGSASLHSTLDAIVGQPIEVAVSRLGAPIGSAPVGSDTVYGWGHAFTSTELLHPTPGFIDAASSQGGVFPAPRRAVQNECVVRVLAGADGVIRDWDYYGNARGCRAYAIRLAGQAVARVD
jgi:hypothetical protein